MRIPFWSVVLLSPLVAACSRSEIPACEQTYSQRGDREAIQELIQEFREAIKIAQRQQNVILLSQARDLSDSRDLVQMEAWVCRVQTQYGRP